MNNDLKHLQDLKLLQRANCLRTKPWRKSSGPRTKTGKAKVSKNLPNQDQSDRLPKIIENLQKLEKTIEILKKRQVLSQQRQLAALKKLEKLAKTTEEKQGESTN